MESKLQTKHVILDSKIHLRPAQWDDLNAVAQLIYDVCEADGDTSVAVTPEELKLRMANPRL